MDKGDISRKELIEYNRILKKGILDVMFRLSETFYIHCTPNPGLIIGKRGLLEKEKEEGIILAFGPYSTRTLSWDDYFIFCEMQFQGTWEAITIPFEAMFRIFDKNGQVLMHWTTYTSYGKDEDEGEEGTKIESIESREKKEASSITDSSKEKEESKDTHTVIEVDFAARKKQKSKKTDDDKED